MSTAGDQTETVPVTRTCAECGEEFEQRKRGRPSVYCRPACRQRAWALRQARATIDAAAPQISSEPVGAPPEPPPAQPAARGRAGASPAAPTNVRGWALALKQLAIQLNDPDSDVARQPWEHAWLYDSLGRALTALDAATPGGLAWLERND